MLGLADQDASVEGRIALVLALISPGDSAVHHVCVHAPALAADAHNVDPAFIGEDVKARLTVATLTPIRLASVACDATSAPLRSHIRDKQMQQRRSPWLATD
ncbi:hypothetical protein [Pseudomonas aeruginosa]|uniref:hypothetical protein n=1 Tax=Pseudomonas aeruginosa TaxID=287 RepID=UPI00141B495D|nr:hypothetical protein [Pseudomonas aeruginosa]